MHKSGTIQLKFPRHSTKVIWTSEQILRVELIHAFKTVNGKLCSCEMVVLKIHLIVYWKTIIEDCSIISAVMAKWGESAQLNMAD